MTRQINIDQLAKEICKRETSRGREVDYGAVRAVIRHLSDLIGEEWRLNFSFTISTALREAAQRRYRKRQSKKDYYKYKKPIHR